MQRTAFFNATDNKPIITKKGSELAAQNPFLRIIFTANPENPVVLFRIAAADTSLAASRYPLKP